MDINADGRVDILVARRELGSGPPIRHAFLNNGNGWDPAPNSFFSPVPFVSRNPTEVHYETKVGQGAYYRDLQVSTTDLNGDGQSDLLFRYGHLPLPPAFGVVDPGKAWCLNRDRLFLGQLQMIRRSLWFIPYQA